MFRSRWRSCGSRRLCHLIRRIVAASIRLFAIHDNLVLGARLFAAAGNAKAGLLSLLF
jgi:hypothetical protein